jgi:hypothetical protein
MNLKPRIAAVFCAVAIAATIAPAGAQAPTATALPFVPGRVLVSFRPGAPAAAALSLIRGTVSVRMPAIDAAVVATPLPVRDAVARLRASGMVRYAEPDFVGHVAATPNDTCIAGCQATVTQWDVNAVNAPAGWDLQPGTFYTQAQKKALGAPVKIAVLDTKIDTHPQDWVNADAEPSAAPWDSANGGQLDMAEATDFLTNQGFTGSAAYHGTFVAGIAGASTNNQLAIAGLGYSAQILPITVVDGTGAVDASDLARGILYASEHGARVINLSLGLADYSQTVQNAIYSAAQPLGGKPGALVVAAAGNNANNAPFYPANMKLVMSVSATDEADRPGACTNFNSSVSVAAPGAGIVSLDPTSGTGLAIVNCGTSTAAPHVSALAALLFAQDPARTPADVRSIIEATADDANSKTGNGRFAGRDDFYGRGRIDFARALQRGLEIRDGLTQRPMVDALFATIPGALNGNSVVTATGHSAPGKQIDKAEWFFDRPGAPGTGGAVDVGAPNSSGAQALSANVPVGLDVQPGVHRVYMRAKDDAGWGAPAVAALIVDRTAPHVANMQASNAIPPAGVPSTVTFDVTDDFSTQASYTITVTRYLVGGSDPVYASTPRTVDIPTTVSTGWMPALTDAGTYTITVTVRDQAGNPTNSFSNVFVI